MARISQGIRKPGARGFTLLEVLIGLSIMTVGIVSIMALHPFTLKANEEAELRTIAASLAMMKIEEIRRDNDENDKLMKAILNLSAPTEAIPFATQPRLAYRFHNRSLLYVNIDPGTGRVFDDPADPRDDFDVARVIIVENGVESGKPRIFMELRFN